MMERGKPLRDRAGLDGEGTRIARAYRLRGGSYVDKALRIPIATPRRGVGSLASPVEEEIGGQSGMRSHEDVR